jgi:hypothetical protein
MRGKLGTVARVGAAAFTIALTVAPQALAHDEPATRPPTAQERAQFEARRSAAARQASAAADPSLGSFAPPFSEPTLQDGRTTDQDCVTNEDGSKSCKPAAGTLNVLPTGKILYWNALEGTENIKTSIVSEYAAKSINDQTRLLDLAGPLWTRPSPNDAGANPGGYRNDPLVPGGNTQANNDGALFCSDQNYLPDGRILATGGTAYYNDPSVPGTDYGVVELEGLRNTRIYDPKTNTWAQGKDTHIGRWYPTLVSLGNGDQFIASGVQKLLKPVYPDRIEGSGSNVKQTETLDLTTGDWNDNGASGQRSLPLFPRLSLLPNGHVYYNAAGQSFNPFGQSYDEALWNQAASYDPETKKWKDLGIPGIGSTHPGFRGSSFSLQLPLRPDAQGRYTKTSYLSAGGVYGIPPSPGGYIATKDSAVTTVDTAAGDQISTKQVGDLNQPRWYSTAVLLPTGDAMAFSGADRDEVATPGTEFPVKQAEMFDHETQTWKPMATATRARTYHNTAVLLPDASVLVGGHATITTLYLNNTTLPGGFTAPNGRDPSFERYTPPYLSCGPQPVIEKADSDLGYGGRTSIDTDVPASEIESVVAVRNPSLTHLVDGDQRSVELPIVSRSGHRVTVSRPPDGNVMPPGPYMIFVNIRGKSCGKLVPSKAAQVFVGRSPSGSARLAAPRGCQKRPFRARVRGSAIDRVTFSLDGRRVKSLSKAGGDGTFSARIDPRRLRSGRHRVSARVEFVTGAGQAARTLRSTFRRCPARKAARRRSPAFTG